MTLQDAIQKMLDFYRAIEKVYADLPREVEVVTEVKTQFGSCFAIADEAVEELKKMQASGINCEHCKYNGPYANACKECPLYRLDPIDQRKPLNYEPI